MAFKKTGPPSVGTRSTADRLHTLTGTLGPVRRRPDPGEGLVDPRVHLGTPGRGEPVLPAGRQGFSARVGRDGRADGVQRRRRPGRPTQRPPGEVFGVADGVGRPLAHVEAPRPVEVQEQLGGQREAAKTAGHRRDDAGRVDGDTVAVHQHPPPGVPPAAAHGPIVPATRDGPVHSRGQRGRMTTRTHGTTPPLRRHPAGGSASSVSGMGEPSGVRQVVVMGVSGVGKTTVAKGISTILGWTFAEGDAFHPESNVAKMSSGQPLTDDDRWPWLRSIGDWMSDEIAAGRSSVVTCSALRRVYRDLLREGRPEVVFCHLTADADLIGDRMSTSYRPLHAGLVAAQPAGHARAAGAGRARRRRLRRRRGGRGRRPRARGPPPA